MLDGEEAEVPEQSRVARSPNPSTPTFVACVGLAAERGRIQLGKPPQPCREMGRR